MTNNVQSFGVTGGTAPNPVITGGTQSPYLVANIHNGCPMTVTFNVTSGTPITAASVTFSTNGGFSQTITATLQGGSYTATWTVSHYVNSLNFTINVTNSSGTTNLSVAVQ